MSSRPLLTQREAATACGVSRSTIRRRREAGDLPGALQDPARGWLIPVEDLLAAGFRLNAPAPPDGAAGPAPAGLRRRATPGGPDAPPEEDAETSTAQREIEELRATLDKLRLQHAAELATERGAREAAEATAAARAEHIADLQSSLRALTAAVERRGVTGPPPPGPRIPTADSPAPAPTVPGPSTPLPMAPPVTEADAEAHRESEAEGGRRRWWRRG